MMSIQEKQKTGFYGKHISISKENYAKLEAMAGYRDTMNSVVTRLLEKYPAAETKEKTSKD
jgi:predicted CopG family antitoxin